MAHANLRCLVVILLVVLLPILCSSPSWSQSYQWAAGFGQIDQDSARSLAIDPEGNVIVTGLFAGTVDFDPGPGTYTLSTAPGSSNPDVFLIKLDLAGRLLWAHSFGNIYLENAVAVAVDAMGNIYCVGDFAFSVDFDPGPGETILSASGSWDTFIVKLNPDGQLLWARSVGGPLTELTRFATVDAGGDVYVGGLFQGTVDFDPGPGVYELTAPEAYYVLKLDPNGNFAWARTVDNGQGATADGAGNLYLAGTVGETGGDIVVAELAALDGSTVWQHTLASEGRAYGITLDGAGNVLVTGEFGGPNDFDPGPGVVELPYSTLADIFLLKLDAGGNFLWARSAGSTGFDTGRSVSTDPAGNVYVAENFEGSVDFDPGPGSAVLTTSGSLDTFMAAFDGSGNHLWATRLGEQGVRAVAAARLGPSGQYVLAGSMLSPSDFIPGPGVALLNVSGDEDAFVAQYALQGSPQAIPALSPIGLILLTAGVAAAGLLALRRRSLRSA